jgi:hypothetical protein
VLAQCSGLNKSYSNADGPVLRDVGTITTTASNSILTGPSDKALDP